MPLPKVDKDNPFWHKIPARFGAETVLENAQDMYKISSS